MNGETDIDFTDDEIRDELSKLGYGNVPHHRTFSNISAISCQSVLMVEYPKKTIDLSQVTGKLYHIIFIVYTSS
jgi:hypothetical protein